MYTVDDLDRIIDGLESYKLDRLCLFRMVGNIYHSIIQNKRSEEGLAYRELYSALSVVDPKQAANFVKNIKKKIEQKEPIESVEILGPHDFSSCDASEEAILKAKEEEKRIHELAEQKRKEAEKKIIDELPKDLCILYTDLTDPEYFKNTFNWTKQDTRLPIYKLKDFGSIDKDIPLFDINNPPYKRAILWCDNYFVMMRGVYDLLPLVSEDKAVGPLTIDTAFFKEHFDEINKYKDLRYGYLNISDLLSRSMGSHNKSIIINKKICCSFRARILMTPVAVLDEAGRQYSEGILSLTKRIKGE